MPDRQIKTKMTVTGLRTVWELRGIPCLEMEEIVPDKKAIGCSRMFGRPIDNLSEMQEAVSAYISRACVKLRKQNLLAGYLHIYIETSRFRGAYYKNSLGMHINPPSAYTPLLSHYGKILLKEIYKSDFVYQRAGVMLIDLVSEKQAQQYFIDPYYCDTKYQKIMKVVDDYNSKVNSGKIKLASEGMEKPWHMKQASKSKRFTTNWDELLTVGK